MAEAKIYNGLITDEGISQARQAKGNIGWYIIPTEYGISDVKGAYTPTRTIDQINSTWYRQAFNSISDVSYLERNKLMFTITIPGNAFTSSKTISEIYFFAKTPQDTEYLYVLIQPINPMTWNPGVTQKMSFVISLSNSDKGDIYSIQFSSPEDIEDHNNDILAHPYLLARDGSRTATGILRYAEKLDFTNPRDIPDLEYVLNAMPTGFMTWWAFPTPPAGYLVRNGAAISRTAYSKLHQLHADAGYPYGIGDGVTTFNIADDRGLYIRGWDNGRGLDTDRSFGSYQADAIQNHSHLVFAAGDEGGNYWSLTSSNYAKETGVSGVTDYKYSIVGVSTYPSKGKTSAPTEVTTATENRVKNRAYLPIIKY